MIRIGEKLNSSISSTREMMAARDAEALAALAQRQLDAGADYLDVNASLFLSDEPEVLAWAVQAIQSRTGAHLMIDSTNPASVAVGLAQDTVGGAIVNSVTPDAARLDAIAPLLLQYQASVVALAMGAGGIPHTARERLAAATLAVDGLTCRGIPLDHIWLDPLVETLASGHGSAAVTLDTIRLMREKWPGIRIVCGLSNISFGLPRRKVINSTFLIAAVAAGLDAAILDAADPVMQQAIAAAEAIAGRDEYCLEYIRYCRANL